MALIFRLSACVAVVATTIVVLGVGTVGRAGADTPITVLNEQFNEQTFPPTSWSTPDGTWSSSCSATIVTAPETGCAAVASFSGGAGGLDELLFDPASGVPANLQNVTLTFYSDFSPDATTQGDSVSVMQALQPGDTGDFSPLVNISGGAGPNDATGTPVLHTVTLPNDNFPLAFRWESFGDSSATSTETWAITNVMITATLPSGATPYALTANRVENTQYPHIVAGTPVTIDLSGSSNPTGDALEFSVSTPPTLGTLGPITQVDATDATVVYTPSATACPDPTGVADFSCADPFYFTVHDIEGNVSAAAQVDIIVLPNGANGESPALSAPAQGGYETINHNSQQVQASDLSGAVTVGPSDFPDELQLELQVSPTSPEAGTFDMPNLASMSNQVTLLNGTASGDSTIYMAGSAPNLNLALSELLFLPDDTSNPLQANLNFYLSDMGATGQGPVLLKTQATTTIVANPVTPPAPSLTLPAGPLAVATNGGTLPLTGFSLVDNGATSTTQDEVALSVSGGSIALPSSDTGGTTQIVTAQSFGDGSALDVTGTVAHLNQALADLTFDPSGLPSETVTLSAYAADQSTGESSPLNASVPITVTEAPFAFGTTAFTTLTGTPATVWLCASGPSGDPLSFTITTPPSNGTLVADLSADPATSGCSQTLGLEAFTYTPNAGYAGADSFTYSVTDSTTHLVSTGNTVAITVLPHQKPTAYAQTAYTNEDEPVTITLCGENPEGSTLTFTITGSPQFGTLANDGTPSVNPCNQGNVAENVTYTPNAGTFTSDGTDGFTYTVSNGAVSNPVTVTINVTTLTPQVVGYSASVDENSSVGLNLCSTAPEGPVTFDIVSGPYDGTLDQQLAASNGPACPTGYFNFGYERYTPNQLFTGTDEIAFKATDGTRTSVEALIDITVNQVEIPPTANPQTVTDFARHPVVVTLTGSSVQGSPLTYQVTGEPSHGTLSGTAPNLVYTPSSNFGDGTDSFTFVANDGVANSAAATVTIDVTTPDLYSSVCYAGAFLNPDQYACSGELSGVASPEFGAIELAHTQTTLPIPPLMLQQQITNESTASDTVTLTAPAGNSYWPLIYDEGGTDVTSQITGAGGLQVTLGPIGSSTATIYVQIVTVPNFNLNYNIVGAPAVVSTSVLAASGNDPSISTSIPIEIQFGSSTPSLSLAQANGSGAVSFPDALQVSPPLYDGGPTGGADILAGMATGGTGMNTFALKATPSPGNTPGVTANFYLGTLNVTSAVLAGTEVVTCYEAPIGCPPLSASLAPGSGSGYYFTELSLTSTIDGQGTIAFASVQLAGQVGPDLFTINPDNGTGVFEPTPVTQVVSSPTELSGSSTKTVFLENDGDVTDTFSLHAALTQAPGDSSVISITATPPGAYGSPGAPADVTGSITRGDYDVTMPPTDYMELQVTDVAGPTTASAPPQVVFTATSQLDPAKVDSYKVTFPTYFYRPDAVLTGPDGSQIGAGVYQQSYGGPLDNNQEAEWNVGISPTTIDVTLADRGQGPWPGNDNVVVTAPTVDSNFDVTYALLQDGTSTDVTAAMTGAGLQLTLGPPGSPAPVIAMSIHMSVSAKAGWPAYYPITVTSSSSLPAGLADVVVVGVLASGQSQLRFGGLPQPEPADITQMVNTIGDTNSRIAPFPDAGYEPGATYGNYPDASGQKFAYVSTYDTFDLQVFASNLAPTSYRVQMVDPGTSLAGLPGWERAVFASPYYNGTALDTPVDPLASGVTPIIMAGGQNVTAAVENGTYATAPLLTYQTSDITVSFSTPAGASLRYTPLKFNLINTSTGQIEDVMVVDPSSIVTCTPDGYQQVQATATTSSGQRELNFEAYNRSDPSSPTACMEHLSHSWVTTAPVVFGAYIPASDNNPAGGSNPVGLWLVPQGGTVLQINTDTLTVTAGDVRAYVDSPFLNSDGSVNTTYLDQGFEYYYYINTFQNLTWNTTDGTNGLAVASDTQLPPSPFPLVKPSDADWPNNTMGAGRYFQVDGLTGTPVMVGEMDVDVPWYNGDVPLIMDLDGTDGLLLNYAAPSDTTASLPGPGGVGLSFYGMYWSTTDDGTVVQGGCLGVPPTLLEALGAGIANPSDCYLEATVTFEPISPTPGAEAQVSQITVGLKNPGLGVKASPEFNLKSLSGQIDLNPANEDVQQVVLDGDFGVGPPTPCQTDKNNGVVPTTWLQYIGLKACPSNYFDFNAQITYIAGSFDNGKPVSGGGVGLQFDGTLSFLNLVNLSNIEADISMSPFNFHFSDSPIDLSFSNSIPISANVTFSGDVGSDGFDISVSGGVEVAGTTIASASGILSTLGIGACGDILGDSMGFGYPWGGSVSIYATGCSTSQFEVSS